jgi:hypothetical protein
MTPYKRRNGMKARLVTLVALAAAVTLTAVAAARPDAANQRVVPRATPTPMSKSTTVTVSRVDAARPMTVWEYRVRAIRICTAANALLDKRAEAIGVVAVVEGKYVQLARRVMAETLPKLRSVSPPRAVRGKYRHLYGLMQQFAEGREAPFTPTRSFWIHEVERGWGLSRCTFDLPR